MATLDHLCDRLGADLEAVQPVPPPPRTVEGVHLSELLDPTPFLTGGELLLTTGMNLTGQGAQAAAYAARLAGHGVAALGFGVGPVHATVPPTLVVACGRAGLPLLSVPERTPFQVVTREFWALVSRAEADVLTAALGAAHALVRSAGIDDDGASVVRTLAGAVGGWAAHLGPRGGIRAVWPNEAAPKARQTAREAARLRLTGPNSSATFPVEGDAVLLHAWNRSGRLRGYVITGRAGPTPATMRHLTLSACALLQLRDEQRQATRAVTTAAPEVIGRLLVLGQAGAAAALAPHLGRRLPTAVRVAAVTGHDPADLQELASAHGAAHACETDRVYLFVGPGSAAALWSAVRGLNAPGPTAPRGVLSAALDARDVPAHLARLDDALATTPPGVFADHTARAFGGDLDEEVLQQLKDHPRADLVATLAAHLRHQGRSDATARELGLHRNTLRHRLEVVRSVFTDAGLHLDDPDVTARWWLGLRRRGLA